MRLSLWPIIGIFFSAEVIAQDCVPTKDLIDTTVSIARIFNAGDYHEFESITLRGTAWFIKRTEMVAIEHVVKEFGLSVEEWQTINIVQQYPGSIWWNEVAVLARIKHVPSEDTPEKLYVLELKEPLAWPIQVVSIRTTPFVIGERAVGIGYSGGVLHSARGQYIHFPLLASLGNPDYFTGFELIHEIERDVLLAGSSGGPIFDCNGMVIAVISHIFPESHYGALPRSPDGRAVLLGVANVLGIPLHHISRILLE